MSIEIENVNHREYLELLEEAKSQSASYSGTEEDYRALTRILERIDILIAQEPTIVGDNSIVRENQAAKMWQLGETPLTISQIIDTAHSSQMSFLQRSFETSKKNDVLSDTVCIQHLSGVILPTKKGVSIVRGENGEGVDARRFEERVVELLDILKTNGIFLDDIIVKSGEIKPNMMRQESYIAIEIPRLSRMVLVCDQVGEATFVVQGSIPDEQLLLLDKEELQQVYVGRVEKVERRNAMDWKIRIQILLFDTDVWESSEETSREKLKMKEIIFWREKIKQEIPTIDAWMDIDTDNRPHLKICEEKGLAALATIFGTEGVPTENTLAYLYLGRKIFGDSPKLFKEIKRLELRKQSESFDSNAWRETVLKEVPTAEEWIRLKDIIRLQGFGGRTLASLARRLGLQGNPLTNFLEYINLGKIFFGDDPVFLLEIKKLEKQKEVKEIKPEDLKENIKTQISLKRWIEMANKEKHNLKRLFGIGVNAIARKFGVEGDPVENRIVFLEIGRKIYGDDENLLEEIRIEKLTLDEWKIEIQKEIGDVFAWLKIKSQDRPNIKILGRRNLKSIAFLFGLDNTKFTNKIHLQLGIKIYGPLPILIESLKTEMMTQEEWKLEISKKVPDAISWIKMISPLVRRDFSVRDIGIKKIARIFEIEGNPIENYLTHLQLGRKIFGDSPEILLALEQKENNS